MGQANMKLNFTESGLDRVHQKLKQLKKESRIEIGSGFKNEEKLNKLLEQRADLQKKLVIAQRNGWEKSEQRLKVMLKTNQNGNLIDKLRLKNLDAQIEKEKSINAETEANIKLKKKQEVENKKNLKLVEDIQKAEIEAHKINNKMIEDRQKMEHEAYQMNSEFDAKRKAEIEKMSKLEYEAHLINKKMEIDKQKVIHEAYQMNQKFDSARRAEVEKMGKLEYEAHLINKKMEVDKQKVIHEAYQMNKVFDEKQLKRKEQLQKAEYDAHQINNKMKEKEQSLIYEAYKMNEKRNESLKDTLRTQELMLAKMKKNIAGKSGYSKLNDDIIKYQNQVKKGIALTKEEIYTLKMQETQAKNSAGSIDKLTLAYGALNLSRAFIQQISQDMNLLANIDQSLYNLGVVAGKSAEEIEIMKTEFLAMGAEVPQSAIELADATDILARSGLGYSDALQTMSAGAKLATAAGEEVADVSKILSKALVAFKLQGESAAAATDSFYSTVLKTPLSLEGLADALKNSASVMSSFISFTSKSGSELKSYKEELLELNTALVGSSVSMGLNASQAGTMLRSSLSRLKIDLAHSNMCA